MKRFVSSIKTKSINAIVYSVKISGKVKKN